jgi:hypothetical protein
MEANGMDWSQFELAMTDSRYMSGEPVFKDEPRMPEPR